jgi:hypothetical protein
MNLRIRGVRDWLYLAFGVANLFIALLMTMAALFSSIAYGFGISLLIVLPTAFGLMGLFEYRQPLTLFMTFGCVMNIIFIAYSAYTDRSGGFPMPLFDKLSFTFSLIGVALSLFRFKQLRQTIGASS